MPVDRRGGGLLQKRVGRFDPSFELQGNRKII
jgi:hypothetical protein